MGFDGSRFVTKLVVYFVSAINNLDNSIFSQNNQFSVMAKTRTNG